jgi:hypothetical protein
MQDGHESLQVLPSVTFFAPFWKRHCSTRLAALAGY